MISRFANKFPFLLVLIGVLGIFANVQEIQKEKAFSKHALTALAEPAGKTDAGQPYIGDLVFTTSSGQTMTIPAAEVPLPVRESFRTASNARVEYLPDDPVTLRFPEWHQKPHRKDMAVPALLLITGLLAIWVLRKSRS
ncbi:hypothetical protein [Undibacterium sp.]|uniref:hypothetical protein n=1 Tax=Undibacterium sp. TaxID=1914977 RepID=UPI00374FE24D